MYRMTSEWLWTLNGQKYPTYSEYHQSPNLCLFYCMTSCFRDTRLLKIRHWKCIEAKSILYISSIYTAKAQIFMSVSLYNSLLRPQTDLWNLNSQSTSYTLSRFTRGPNVSSFCSMTSRFRDIGLAKIGKTRVMGLVVLLVVLKHLPWHPVKFHA